VFGLAARHWGRILEAGLSIASVLYGALLGVFCSALLPEGPANGRRYRHECGFVVTFLFRTQVAYTWYVLLGSLATFIVGYSASFLLPAMSRFPSAPEPPLDSCLKTR